MILWCHEMQLEMQLAAKLENLLQSPCSRRVTHLSEITFIHLFNYLYFSFFCWQNKSITNGKKECFILNPREKLAKQGHQIDDYDESRTSIQFTTFFVFDVVTGMVINKLVITLIDEFSITEKSRVYFHSLKWKWLWKRSLLK